MQVASLGKYIINLYQHKLYKVQGLSPSIKEKTYSQFLKFLKLTLVYQATLASTPIPEDVYLFKKYLLEIYIYFSGGSSFYEVLTLYKLGGKGSL